MKSVGFVLQAALPLTEGWLWSRILISGLLCAEMGLLCSVPRDVGIIFTLCALQNILKSLLVGSRQEFLSAPSEMEV